MRIESGRSTVCCQLLDLYMFSNIPNFFSCREKGNSRKYGVKSGIELRMAVWGGSLGESGGVGV
jgi:hypothetical protein